ncbi:protein GRAVITROPIC IN THE LIGHT 1-like [Lolium rigidum]|uniref:protein GRAVITROPIC IN THE LIGHT 1-like n=1 Tax=Lolium rigidum TaxID=89674 RepID=UPI001F5D69EC|nr:protein GRAVITROPIC IN THE LIGHT 1-like [Lolium rigidum]XP_047055103.1 protein GRAVITROPIC IN THE LIGHT 1-like [Lolium rigidum]XP_047055104.1 protein GRAVITROPIC IN THE LIGHT 1-like [Lolium rigidum]
MEATTRKARRTPSGLLCRISDICKVHSVGVAPTVREKKPKAEADSTATGGESSEDGAHLKVHPRLVSSDSSECLSETSSARCEEAVVDKLLDAISGLKVAYVNLQQALMPYDPEEIMIADERFASVLEETAELKDLYVNVKEWSNPRYPYHLNSRIQEHQNLVMELQADICKKDSQIGWLRPELDELERKNVELEEKIGRSALCREGSFTVRRGVSTEMFMDLYERSAKCIHDFAKFVIGWAKVSGWNLGQSTFPIDSHVVYERKADKKYAVEAYFACVMLMGDRGDYISLDSFDCIMSFRDPFDALMSDPDSNFGRYCRAKYLLAVPQSMENSFFGNLDHRAFVESGGHPRTQFYQKFVKMARYAWALLAVARSLNPRAEMFYVNSGVQFRKEHMESTPAKMTTEEEKFIVGFTVMPGFKVGCTVVRCRVYLSKVNTVDF